MTAMFMSTALAAVATTASSLVGDSLWFLPPQSPVEISSVTRCSTRYASTVLPWGPSTDYFTSTSYAYRQRFELLTPNPVTTSVLATSTYTQYETAPNNLTRTIWTDTYTFTNYVTTTETVSSTATFTTSEVQTATIPTRAGFVPVAAIYPEATRRVDDSADEDEWSVEDAYWQDDWTLPQELEAPELLESNSSSNIECLITIINIYSAGITTSRLSLSPPTYTRTTYVATETTTITVTTRISPTETPVTWSLASGLESLSWLTETHTNVATVSLDIPDVLKLRKPAWLTSSQITTTADPTTTSSYAACATDNIVNAYQDWPLYSLADDWYNNNYSIISPRWDEVTNAVDCCATAAANPYTIFFKYDGYCEIFVEEKGVGGYNTSDEVDVLVFYEPREWYGWGITVGNGPRGSIRFSSLWV